jgi:hypothetical protein
LLHAMTGHTVDTGLDSLAKLVACAASTNVLVIVIVSVYATVVNFSYGGEALRGTFYTTSANCPVR